METKNVIDSNYYLLDLTFIPHPSNRTMSLLIYRISLPLVHNLSPLSVIKTLITFILVTSTLHAIGQKQLVLLRNERVLLRLKPGDEFVYRLKGSKTIRTSYVNNLSDNYVLAHRDTVPFNSIDRIYFRQEKFYNRLGTALFIGGTALFLIDQINVVIVNGDNPNLDSWVSTVSASSIIVGLPMMLLKKKSQKLNYRYRLLTVKKGSHFYQHDPREPISPFLETN